MKQSSLIILFFICVITGSAQVPGDYRTRSGAGFWNDATRWDVFNAGSWVPLTSPSAGTFQNIIPTNASGQITVRNNISINSSININQTIIQDFASLTINAGITVRIQDDLAITPLNIQAGASVMVIGTLDMQSLLSATPCQIFGTLTNSGTVLTTSNPSLIVFNDGSNYRHSKTTGGSFPTATWTVNSTCHVLGLTNTNPMPPSNLNQSFGNFIWNTPTMGATTVFSLNGQLRTVNGDMTIVSTGSTPRDVKLDNGGPGTPLVIGGSLTIQNGIFTLSASQTSSTTVSIGSDLRISGGTLNLGLTNNAPVDIFLNGNFQKTGGALNRGTGAGAATLHFNGSDQSFASNGGISGAVNYAVENGSNLDLGTSSLTGAGAFRLNDGATIQVKSTDTGGAIQTGTSGGNIRTTGLRTYIPGSSIVYNGLATQFAGTGHPPEANMIIDNMNNVTMAGDVTINGDLIQTEGALLIGSSTLTMGGTYSRVNGYLGISTFSDITINGSGDFGELFLVPVEFAGDPINNLTINRAGTVVLVNPLVVAGIFNQTNGDFSVGQTGANTLTLQGPFRQTGGSLSIISNSSLVIEGTGTLPADAEMTGSDIHTFTMNRIGETFGTTSSMTIQNLNLFNGILDNAPASIAIAPEGLVTRHATGTITGYLEAITTFDVIYDVSTDVISGGEIPQRVTALNNLTKSGPGKVDLDQAAFVNGTFIVNQGIFNIGAGKTVTIGKDLIVNGTLLSNGITAFTGNVPQTISGLTPVTFTDLVIDQTVSSTLSISIPVDITNSLSVNSASTFNAGTNLLKLVSNASATAYVSTLAPGASIEGSVIVQRYLPNDNRVRMWKYIACPVTGAFVSDWKTELAITGTFSDPATGPGIVSRNPSMYIYDETFVTGGPTLEDRYRPYPVSGPSTAAPLLNGKGYAVFARTTGAMTFDSRGRPGQGTVSVNVTHSGGALSGWNLVGNPYPAPLDWKAVAASFTDTNIRNSITITDNTSGGVVMISYVDGVGVPESFQGVIAPGQSFWVYPNVNTTLTFEEAHKANSQAQFFREGKIDNLLRIKIKKDSTSDEIAIRLHEEATDLFDDRFDALRFHDFLDSLDSLASLSLSSRSSDNQKLIINSVGMLSESVIPLVIENAVTGAYTFDFTGMQSFDPVTVLQLRDNALDSVVDITTSPQYTFVIHDTLSSDDRFEIFIVMPSPGETALRDKNITHLAEKTFTDPDILVYPNPVADKVFVKLKSYAESSNAKLIGPTGVELNAISLTRTGEVNYGEFDLTFYPSGVYLIQIQEGQKFYSRKVIKLN